MPDLGVEVSALAHRFASGKGIEEVTFSVPFGAVLGYLGPNGSGKTTTLRCLMGFLRPQAGSARVAGLDPWADAAAAHRHVGYLSSDIRLFPDLGAAEHLRLAQAVCGRGASGTYAKELAARFAVDLTTPFRRLSKGQRQVAGLLVAFAHDPEVLLLDEPSTGLDPVMQDRFVAWVRDERDRGKAVLLSSHRFDEVERTADLVCLLRDGRVAERAALADLRARHRRRYRLDFESEGDAVAFMADADALDAVNGRERRGRGVEVEATGSLAPLARAAGARSLVGWHEVTGDLEDAFRHLYPEERAQSAAPAVGRA